MEDNIDDFSAENRNSAIWSGDSRKVANGKANEVILTKLNKLPIPDLSGVEAVQMGHIMEPVIGRLAQNQLGVELTKISGEMAHKKHPWFKSHFDFGGNENGKSILVECKNYNHGYRSKFDDTANIVPPSDLAQLIHEAAVAGVDRVYLAVLFGGQEFCLFPFDITEEQKEDLIKKMAEVWGHVQTGTTMPPESVEQCKLLYPVDVPGTVKTASQAVEQACLMLKTTKEQIKALETQEEQLQTLIQGYMAQNSSLHSVDGQVLATWKNAKSSRRFDSKLFQQSMPDIYEQFCIEAPGSRRFLLK
jgi:predicted phage-related endonuclease